MIKTRFSRMMTNLLHKIGPVETLARDLDLPHKSIVEEWCASERLPTTDELNKLRAHLNKKKIKLTREQENIMIEVQKRIDGSVRFLSVPDVVATVAEMEVKKKRLQEEISKSGMSPEQEERIMSYYDEQVGLDFIRDRIPFLWDPQLSAHAVIPVIELDHLGDLNFEQELIMAVIGVIVGTLFSILIQNMSAPNPAKPGSWVAFWLLLLFSAIFCGFFIRNKNKQENWKKRYFKKDNNVIDLG